MDLDRFLRLINELRSLQLELRQQGVSEHDMALLECCIKSLRTIQLDLRRK